MPKYQYLSDVMAQKRKEHDTETVRWNRADAARTKQVAKFTPRTDLHPAVGVLINAKGVRYYAYIDSVYREGSPEHLATLLTA